MPRPFYMDHHATTPVLPEVLDAMLPYLREEFGNPSSVTHAYGRAAADAVEAARRRVAALIGASPAEIVFTSGATEANNLAILGGARAAGTRGRHVVTCAVEHESVLEPFRSLAKEGFEAESLPVDRHGLVDPGRLLEAIRPDTVLVSVQTANNEIGTLQPVEAIGRITREKGIVFHSDAVQAAGRVPVDVRRMNADMVSLSAHKMYGPKGMGALWIRKGVPVAPLLHGGGQEKRRRPGTLNVPAIAGFGAAAEAARRDMAGEAERLAALRDRLWDGIRSSIDGVVRNGHPTLALPNNLNVAVLHVEAEALLLALRDVAALSSGSACSTGAIESSHVLRAIGLDDQVARGAIRFGLGRENTAAQVDALVERLAAACARLRALSPHHAAAAARPAPPRGDRPEDPA